MTKTQQIYQNQYRELMEEQPERKPFCAGAHTCAPSVTPAHSLCRGVTAPLLLPHGQNTAIWFGAEPQVFL